VARWGPQAGVRGAALMAKQELRDDVAASPAGSPA